ncbi:MAG: hypothetical protein HY960_14390 [Ignavibacteriae bacterium]|nr:hypothetical protein [Ignavibacteriota bacterium]
MNLSGSRFGRKLPTPHLMPSEKKQGFIFSSALRLRDNTLLISIREIF